MDIKGAWEQPAQICQWQTILDQHNCLQQDDQKENRKHIYTDFSSFSSDLQAKLVSYGMDKWTAR